MLRARLLAAACGALIALSVGAPASAAPSPTAAQSARVLLDHVHVLQGQTDTALAGYDTALDAVANAVSAGIGAQQRQQADEDAANEAQDRLDGRVRALYISGGPAAMLSALLSSTGLADLTSRVVTMQHLVADGRDAAARDAGQAGAARTEAAAARARALRSLGTAGDVLAAANRLQTLLGEQQALLATADATVQRLRTAEKAAAVRATRAAAVALRATTRAAARATATATQRIAPMAGSAAYLALYRSAALTCPGLPWTVLAAVGQVESGHGRNTGHSPAGAQGPMQFLPATFAAYAVDGDRDGRTDMADPADAIYTAAHFLCVHGAGSGPAGVREALLFYNHAGWYVDLVVALAARYAGVG